MSNVFVFRPGAVETPENPIPPNVAISWSDLMEKLSDSDIGGRKIIEFDDTNGKCEIPADGSPHEMRDVSWAGFGPRTGQPRTIVEIADGASFSNLRMIGGQIAIVNKATSLSPIADFDAAPNVVSQVQIGLRDDCGSTQIVNEGTVPLFEIRSNRVFFFLQNCLFGVTGFGPVSMSPLVHVTAPGELSINLLGQSNLGENVVRAENGAIVRFGVISLASQIAAVQDQITKPTDVPAGVLRISPLGRIQREIIPLPPETPLTGPLQPDQPDQAIGVPNALIRCDGRILNVQTLPKIVGELKIRPGGVDLYTGGQELIVAEVKGGPNLSVSPSSGDTIDGSTGLVQIGRHGSRTFVSDGSSNWITISVVPDRRLLQLLEHPDLEPVP